MFQYGFLSSESNTKQFSFVSVKSENAFSCAVSVVRVVVAMVIMMIMTLVMMMKFR